MRSIESFLNATVNTFIIKLAVKYFILTYYYSTRSLIAIEEAW